jgi:hypothetical protein
LTGRNSILESIESRLQDILERRKKLEQRSAQTLQSMRDTADESLRVADYASNVARTLNDLDAEFEKQTELTKIDITFLFFATALQCARQYLLTGFPERLTDQEAANSTPGHTPEHSNRSHWWYNPPLNEIITSPVPFDAMYGSPDFELGLSGWTHRGKTLGHDPVLGWIFGTANIATSTLTTNDLASYHVKTGTAIKRDKITNYAQTPYVFYYTKEKLLNNGIEGKKVIATSLVKEAIHLKSDINTKKSLPFPIVSAVSPELANTLASYGIDMANIANIGKQAAYSILINTLIGMTHYLIHDFNKGESRKLYEVRTRKILSYSNYIASASNLLYVTISAGLGNAAAFKKMDIGGFIVTLYRLISDSAFIQKIKEEFVFGNFRAKIQDGNGAYIIE